MKELNRNGREKEQQMLFDAPEDWRKYWWGMPAFEMKDVSPQFSVTINFLTIDDLKEFSKKTGILLTSKSDSCWYPYQKPLNGKFYYDGKKIDSRYPICIPSKGRANIQKTGKALDQMGVTYRFFVEDTEYDDYCAALGEKKVVCLPFNNLGQGSIPARNFIWDWAEENNYARHWVVDDNIVSFARTHINRRLVVRGGGFFNAMEDFADRYENLTLVGPHDIGFIKDRLPMAPIIYNSRIYSCTLIDTGAPYRWRGRYNEDTDLSLRVLKDGRCTALFRALCMNKGCTAFSRNAKPLAGGNTDNVYNTNDYRLAFANSLKEQHPDVVKVVWKYNRWHHQVDYKPFAKNKPILKRGIVKNMNVNNYGMELVQKKDEHPLFDDERKCVKESETPAFWDESIKIMRENAK